MTGVVGLILAAQRPGERNPVAIERGVSHKCIAPVAGVPMITHVVDCLRALQRVERILVSIDDPAVLAQLPGLRRYVEPVQSGVNLADSVALAMEAAPGRPLLITTADNVLHTPEMLDYFWMAANVSGADGAFGMTHEKVMKAKFPEGQRRFYRFRDGGYSNCNLYALLSPNGLKAARAFAGGGQFIKHKKRMIQAFGWFNVALFATGLLSLPHAGRRLSHAFGARIAPIHMPFAEAPIDVDNVRTLNLAETILHQRETSPALAA
jgi:MobA-like NTP transferase domain